MHCVQRGQKALFREVASRRAWRDRRPGALRPDDCDDHHHHERALPARRPRGSSAGARDGAVRLPAPAVG
eukprot:6480271-Heterocapsa_arctica.AAC.1